MEQESMSLLNSSEFQKGLFVAIHWSFPKLRAASLFRGPVAGGVIGGAVGLIVDGRCSWAFRL